MAVSQIQKDEIKRLLVEGKKIEAIKYIRSNFNLDLKEAKTLADHIEVEYDIHDYERATIGNSQKRKPTNATRTIGKVFMSLGLLIFFIAIFIYFQQAKLSEKSIMVIGTVEGNLAQPTFKYEFNGNTYRYLSSVTSNPPSYYLGEEVEIFVDTENPENILVNTILDRWFFILFISGFASLFSVVGFTIYKISNR
ncbi:MAG TPA: DUF3592 domain-containing protein [Fulvivirga sp.]|nr:DUF3592 domain-containing protein [Fulvivirga sp.]